MSLKKTSSPAVIEARNLSFNRNGEEIIHDFSFEIAEGSYVGVIGPNGGGKTTLLRLLLGLIEPTSGEVRVLGGKATDGAVRRRIGYVPQRGGNLDAQFPATVEEVVRAGRAPLLGLGGRFRPADEAAVAKAAKTMGIEPLWGRPIGR